MGELRNYLLALLDQVDYVAGNCQPTEMVGALVDHRLLEKIHELQFRPAKKLSRTVSIVHPETGDQLDHVDEDAALALVEQLMDAFPDLFATWNVIENVGSPAESGYYLAAWGESGQFISELWFNKVNGWFRTRGYMGERFHGMQGKISSVVAWMELPQWRKE